MQISVSVVSNVRTLNWGAAEFIDINMEARKVLSRVINISLIMDWKQMREREGARGVGNYNEIKIISV